MLVWILIFSLVGSIGSLLASALFLLFPEGIRRTLVPVLISYASGTLLAAAFLGMIPSGLQNSQAFPFSVTVLAGIVLFFCWKSSCYGDTRMATGRKWLTPQRL